MASITARAADGGSASPRRRPPAHTGSLDLVPDRGVRGRRGLGRRTTAGSDYRVLTSAKYSVVSYTVPTAPHLIAGPGETVYRIDPTHSSVSYAVGEKLFGHTAHTAVGTTNGIAGDSR